MFDMDFDGDIDSFDAVTELLLVNDGFGDDKMARLEESGLDAFDLSLMGENQRRGALEDAGLDPDDYDEYDFY